MRDEINQLLDHFSAKFTAEKGGLGTQWNSLFSGRV
jgi:hypothetical protein